MKIIDLTNLTHKELVDREMKLQNISREEAEKYWKDMYEQSTENDRQHEEFLNSMSDEEYLADTFRTKLKKFAKEKDSLSQDDTSVSISFDEKNLDEFLTYFEKGINDSGNYLLNVAIENNNLELVSLMLSKNAELITNGYGGYYFTWSDMVKNHHFDMIKLLFSNGINDKTHPDLLFSMINYCAVQRSKEFFELGKFLIENGADVNNGSPLMKSLNAKSLNFFSGDTIYGSLNFEMAKLLIENGSNVNFVDDNGESILISACKTRDDYIDIGKRPEPKYEIINMLINSGANIHHKDNKQNSVIMFISDSNQESEKILKLLIDNGADINHKNYMGITPLMHYALKGEDRLVKILLENGADINAKSEMTAFDLAKTDEIKFLIKQSKNNSPQRLVKLLSNFTIDKPIKYTTHDWDFGELKKEYGNFEGYMNAVKKQFEIMKNELEELSPNLYKKIYTFLMEENPDKNYSWCHKTNINIGWSSLIGLKEYCDAGNKPDNFILPNSIFYEGRDLTTFKDVINLFKQEIEIRENFKNLETLFTTQKNKLGTGRNSIFNLKLSTAKLNRQFYTDVEKFSNVLDRIFGEIKIRTEFPNIEVITTELEDRSIEIKIIQIDSISNKSASDLLKEVEDGDFAEIKLNFQNLCDWSIESSFENKNFRINYLHSNNVKEIVSLDEKPKGFIHIFRFYK